MSEPLRSIAAMTDEELVLLLEGDKKSLVELRPYNGTAQGAQAIANVRKHMEKVRNEQARRRYPEGTTVQTIVYSIGNRSETVSGTVTGYIKGMLLVQTEAHGQLCVELGKVL